MQPSPTSAWSPDGLLATEGRQTQRFRQPAGFPPETFGFLAMSPF